MAKIEEDPPPNQNNIADQWFVPFTLVTTTGGLMRCACVLRDDPCRPSCMNLPRRSSSLPLDHRNSTPLRAVCNHCKKAFTLRGIGRHLNACPPARRHRSDTLRAWAQRRIEREGSCRRELEAARRRRAFMNMNQTHAVEADDGKRDDDAGVHCDPCDCC